jgi:hypothetical protein
MDLRAMVLSLQAQHAAMGAQLAVLLEACPQPVPKVRVSKPERCEGVEACGLEDGDSRIDKGTLGSPGAWKCQGCGYTERPT